MGRFQGQRLNQAFRDQLAAGAWDPVQPVAPGMKGVAAQPGLKFPSVEWTTSHFFISPTVTPPLLFNDCTSF